MYSRKSFILFLFLNLYPVIGHSSVFIYPESETEYNFDDQSKESSAPLICDHVYPAGSYDSIDSLVKTDQSLNDSTEKIILPHLKYKLKVDDIYEAIKEGGIDMATLTVSTFIEITFNKWLLKNNIFGKISFSPFSYCPQPFWEVAVVASFPCGTINLLTHHYFGDFVSLVISAPLFEELMFRLLIQNVILNKIPHWVLGKVAPQYASYTNHQLIQLLRASLVGTAFGVAHVPACDEKYKEWILEVCPGIGVPQINGGIIYGMIMEKSNSSIRGIVRTIFAHMMYNFMCSMSNN